VAALGDYSSVHSVRGGDRHFAQAQVRATAVVAVDRQEARDRAPCAPGDIRAEIFDDRRSRQAFSTKPGIVGSFGINRLPCSERADCLEHSERANCLQQQGF